MANLTKSENRVESNNQIMNFVNDEFGSIRCIEIDNEPWFVGNDVSKALRYSNYRNAVSNHVDAEDKLHTQIEDAGQKRTVTLINKYGFYSLCSHRRKTPYVKDFKQWVQSEILTTFKKSVLNSQELVEDENISLFNSPEFGDLHILTINNKPYFVANDIAKALGYKVPKDAVRAHCKGALKHRHLTNGGFQELNIIPEGDVYRLIIRSKLPTAEKFESWVFDEVLPQIRRTGGYIPYKNLSEAEFVLKALEIQQTTIAELRGELEASKEDVDFARCVTASSDTIDMNTMAKLLQNDGYDIGRNRLFEILRNNGILMRDNMPYQRYVENGCFEVGEHVICNVIVPQTYVTGKGQKLVYRVVRDLED